jgi:HAUS augmin-like complex subunit 1
MDPTSPIDSPLLSPAKARQQAVQVKDWAYVNSWLSRQYAPKPVPHFERNEDTLRTLLALAAANDTADEEATLLHRAREETVREYKAREDSEEEMKRMLLDEMEACLDENGSRDLDDLAETTAALGTLSAETTDLGQSIIELTKDEFDARDQVSRVEMLHKYLERELAALREELETLKSDKAYQTPAELPEMTSEWSRGTKQLIPKIDEYQDRTASLERTRTKGPTIEHLVAEEESIIGIKDTVAMQEARVRAFRDLPKGIEGATAQYKQLECELARLAQQRNSMLGSLERR